MPLQFSKDLDAYNPNTPEWREDLGLVVARLLAKVPIWATGTVPRPVGVGEAELPSLHTSSRTRFQLSCVPGFLLQPGVGDRGMRRAGGPGSAAAPYLQGQGVSLHPEGACVPPAQETGIPQELLVAVVKPGLPTLADLYVLLPPARPTRKRSLTGDKVRPGPAAGSRQGGQSKHFPQDLGWSWSHGPA